MSDVYYTGAGALHFEGKDYGYGDALPEGLPEASVASMLTNGKASTTKPAGVVVKADANDMALLQRRISELTAQLAQAQQTIADLTEQLTKPPVPADKPAGAGSKK